MRQESIDVKVGKPRPGKRYHVHVMLCDTKEEVIQHYTDDEIVKAINYVAVLLAREKVRKEHCKETK
jgi:hypothetical protein